MLNMEFHVKVGSMLSSMLRTQAVLNMEAAKILDTYLVSNDGKDINPADKLQAPINKLKKSGNFEEFLHLFNRTEIELSFLENIAVTLRKNSQMVRMIQASTFMSANEKAQMIDQIYMMMIETAKMANDMVLTTRKFKKEYKKKKK